MSSPFKVEKNPLWGVSSSSSVYSTPKLKPSSSKSSPVVVPAAVKQYNGLRSFTKAELKQHLPMRMAENTTKDKMIFAYLADKYQSVKGKESSFQYWTVGSLRTYVTTELNMTTSEITHYLGDMKKVDWMHLAMLVDINSKGGVSGRRSEIDKLREFLEANFTKCR